MKKLNRLGIVAVTALAVSIGGVAMPASAEPSGQYVLNCITGSGTTIWTNNPPASCNGYIDVYLNGQKQAHINMSNAYIRQQLASPTRPLYVPLSCVAGAVLWSVAIPTYFTPVGWTLGAAGMAVLGLGCAGY